MVSSYERGILLRHYLLKAFWACIKPHALEASSALIGDTIEDLLQGKITMEYDPRAEDFIFHTKPCSLVECPVLKKDLYLSPILRMIDDISMEGLNEAMATQKEQAGGLLTEAACMTLVVSDYLKSRHPHEEQPGHGHDHDDGSRHRHN